MKKLIFMLSLMFSVCVMAQEPLKDLPTDKVNYECIQETATGFEFLEIAPVVVFEYSKPCSTFNLFCGKYFSRTFSDIDRVFTNHYRSINLSNKFTFMNYGNSFGQAIEALKQGKRVARAGWNGKGMFIFMRPADELHVNFVAKEIKSLPQSVKDYYHQDCVDYNGNPLDLDKDDVVKFTAYICLKAVDGTIVNGWLASQTDMLADDWVILG